MGNFRIVLDDWKTSGRADDVKTIMPVLQMFETSEPGIYENIDTESVNPFPLVRLIESLLIGPNATPTEILSTVCSFCYRNQRLGPPRLNAQRATLGRVQTRSKLEEWLRSDSSGFSTARSGRAGPIVDKLLTLELADLKLLLEDIPITRVIAAEPKSRTVWSFFQDGEHNPYDGVTKSTVELLRRLGLGENDPNEEHIAWSHQLNSGQTAHWPTAIDAADCRYYRPGGKTNPLSPPPNGLDETVHGAVYGRDLADRIESTG